MNLVVVPSRDCISSSVYIVLPRKLLRRVRRRPPPTSSWSAVQSRMMSARDLPLMKVQPMSLSSPGRRGRPADLHETSIEKLEPLGGEDRLPERLESAGRVPPVAQHLEQVLLDPLSRGLPLVELRQNVG